MSWEYVNLSEVAEFKNGVNFNKSSFGLGMKVINVGDFKDKLYPNYLTLPQINPDGVVKESDLLKNGDILFVRSNGNKELVGRSMFIDKIEEPITFSGFCIRCRFKSDKVYPLFYAYLFKSQIIRNTISNSANGTNITNLNQTLLNNLKVPKINISTQKRIASILSTYDDFIENNLKRIKLLEETAQNIYKEWFVNFRFPNYEYTEFDVESGLPKGWEMKKLSELVILTMGQSPKSEFYNENKEGLPFHQGVTGYGHRFVSHSTYCSVVTRIAEEGDILFSVRAPVGRLNIAPERLIIGRGLSSIRNKKNCQSFQLYQLKNHFFQEDLIGGGAIFNSVTKNDLENQLMILPSSEVVDEFEKIVKPIDEQIWKLNLQNQKLKEARDILLPRLMNRTIEV